jgi:hypothetical protein
MNTPMKHSRRPGPSRQRGWVAIGFAVLGATAAGWLLLAAVLDRQQLHKAMTVEGRDRSLDWAQAAVQQFAARHSRLPCPARQVDGPEDCSVGAKGWLPSAALTAVAGSASSMPMYYLVYRGNGKKTGPDLAGALSEVRSPQLADESDASASGHLTGLDFCESLRWGRETNRWNFDGSDHLGSTDVAYVQAGPRASTVAFALAMAPVPGQEAESPPVNADLSRPVFEIGAAANASADLVRFTTFGALSAGLACSTSAAALDTLAIGSSWAAAADSSRAANVQAGHDTADIVTAIFVASDGMSVIQSRQDIVNGHSAIAEAAAEIVALTPGIPATLPKIALQETAIVTATVGLGFAKFDLIKNTINVLVSSAYLAAYKVVAAQAEAIPVWHDGEQWLDEADKAGLLVAGGQ